MAARDPPSFTSEELVRVVEYKLLRGKWRPRLLTYAKALSDGQVRDLTTGAIGEAACLGKKKGDGLSKAMKILMELKVRLLWRDENRAGHSCMHTSPELLVCTLRARGLQLRHWS